MRLSCWLVLAKPVDLSQSSVCFLGRSRSRGLADRNARNGFVDDQAAH
jgi:hypothetical protein